jgi:hypothetical protein
MPKKSIASPAHDSDPDDDGHELDPDLSRWPRRLRHDEDAHGGESGQDGRPDQVQVRDDERRQAIESG